MLASLLRDLSISGIGQITTLVHAPLDASTFPATRTVPVAGNLFDVAVREMQNHDAAWIIAPETGGALLELTRLAESLGKKVIGPSSSAVEICGDKRLAYARLEGSLDMPETVLFNDSFNRFPCVVKPADGAGCESTFLLKNRQELQSLHLPHGDFVVQPYLEGKAMSAAIVCHNGETVLLGVSRQLLEINGQMKFKGVRGPIEYQHRDRIGRMVSQIQKNIAGLDGYWGIDFIDCGGNPALIEINPRLTSSYPVYSASSKFNIARFAVLGERA